jgi:C terminal of Calcineurin-like phosphoesterase
VRLLGSPVPREALSASTLIANVFDGGEKTKVKMVIGDRAPIEMTRRPRPDPFVQEVFARNEATKKAWVKAEDSSHIWTARLPGDLAPGTYPVVVEAVGEYGQPLSGRLALEVTG